MSVEQSILSAAKVRGGLLSWAEYTELCLYGEGGYYRKNAKRVGADGDFFTSSSLKHKVFGRLMKAAAKNLLRKNGDEADSPNFLEIGAEPERTIIPDCPAIRLGDEIKIPENCVVISNELLDARPFDRFKFIGGTWKKCFIDFDNARAEALKAPSPRELITLEKYFPRARVENFCIDISFDAIDLFESICAQMRGGLLIFADYFRSAAELSEMPRGTARTYFKHAQGDDIFAHAGDADITYSPCSDIFEDIARKHNFTAHTPTQESFFIENAAEETEKIISSPDPVDPLKRELAQLISPVHMGVCFRIFYMTGTGGD